MTLVLFLVEKIPYIAEIFSLKFLNEIFQDRIFSTNFFAHDIFL